MKIELLAYTPDAERLVASSAKLCYSKVGIDEISGKMSDEQVEKFINHLMNIGHESPIEHVSFTFAVEGVSRVFSHQLVRHRLASFSQQSQRYVTLQNFEYITPPQIKSNKVANDIFEKQMAEASKAYSDMVEELVSQQVRFEESIRWDLPYTPPKDSFKEFWESKKGKQLMKSIEKKAIEDARFVFPNACETKLVFTMNARTLMNFFKHRCCNRAQWEIRDVANEMLSKVREVAPTLFKYAGAPCSHGSCPEGEMTCGNPIRINK